MMNSIPFCSGFGSLHTDKDKTLPKGYKLKSGKILTEDRLIRGNPYTTTMLVDIRALVDDPITKIGGSGKPYCNFLLAAPVGDEQPVIVSGIAFGDVAERIGQLMKGDALAVTGALKPSTWNDKTTGEEKHGLNITVSAHLSVYDITKRRKKPDSTQVEPSNKQYDFDDPITF